VAAAVEPFDTAHHDTVGPRAFDVCAHRHQAVGQVDDFRLLGRVVDHRGAFGERRSHQHVLGRAHADDVERHLAAAQAVGAGLDEAMLERDPRAKGLQRLDVQVDRARADGATAGQRDFRRAMPGQQRAKHQHRCAHGLDQFVRGDMAAHGARIDLQVGAVLDDDAGTQFGQQAQRGLDVVQVGHVADRDRLVGQQGGAQDGQHGVLGARDGHLAVERDAAADDDLLHSGAWLVDGRGGAGARAAGRWESVCVDVLRRSRAVARLLRRVLRRGHRTQRQGVDLPAHQRPERGIHQAMPRQRELALERVGHHQRLEVHAVVALHRDAGAGQALFDQLANGVRVQAGILVKPA